MALVNPKEMYAYYAKSKKAICAFNVVNIEVMRAIVGAASERKTPVMLQCSSGAISYYGLEALVTAAKLVAKEFPAVDFALHLDHGDSFDLCKQCIDAGFTSVMIDASHKQYEENVKETKKVVDYARKRNVFVEAELGRISGIEDAVNVAPFDAFFTKPDEAKDFIKKTGIDTLAISIGTSHGAYKLPTPQGLKIDIVKAIKKANPDTYLVLHGASTVDKSVIDAINAVGGDKKETTGTSKEEIKKAIEAGVTKINIDTDLRLAFTLGVRTLLKEKPGEFDIRKIVGAGAKAVAKTAGEKLDFLSV